MKKGGAPARWMRCLSGAEAAGQHCWAAILHGMVTRMKTTIEISDPLFERAKRVAAREKTTVRALVERGLRQVVEERRPQGAFRLRRASFKGRGLRRELGDRDWQRVRELAYEGRGG